MIEGEVNKLKFNFDPYKTFESQAEEVLKFLKKVMPISLEEVVIQFKIPATYVGEFYGPFRNFGKIQKEFYDQTGNLNLEIKATESSSDKIIEFAKRHSNNESEYRIIKN